MGSVSSLIPGARSCRDSDRKPKKVFKCKRGGLLKHSHEHNAKDNTTTKLGHAPNSDEFFYIQVSHKARDDKPLDDTGLRKTQTDLIKVCARLEQNSLNSFLPQFPQSSSSSVETYNSLRAILGATLDHIDRPKNKTPEPKNNMSSGSPCDSGIYGSSWTNDGANSRTKWPGGVHGDDRMSRSSTRSTSVFSDCISNPASLKMDTAAKKVEIICTSPVSEQSVPSVIEPEVPEERHCYSSEQAFQAQQLLQLQVLQLQQDKDRLQEEVDQLIRDRDTIKSQLIYKRQQTPLTPTLEETQWEVCQKVGEISLLKQQLKDSQADMTNKLSEIVSLRAALREVRSKVEKLEEKHQEREETLHLQSTEMEVCKYELLRKKNEAELLREKTRKLETDVKTLKQDLLVAKEEHLELLSLKAQLQEQQRLLQVCQSKMADQEMSKKVEVLQKEVENLREQLEDEKQKEKKIMSSFHREKQTWDKERDKVIRYQKQLQFNYLQMHRKNQELVKKKKEKYGKVDNWTEKDRDRTLENMDLRKTGGCYDGMVATEI